MINLFYFFKRRYLTEVEFTYTVAPLHNREYTFECLAYCHDPAKTIDLIKLFRPFSVNVVECKITNIFVEKIPVI